MTIIIMNKIQYVTKTFGTKLTSSQLNQAIRVGALLHGCQLTFANCPGSKDTLILHSNELVAPFIATLRHRSVVFAFAEADGAMLGAIRKILDDELMFEMPISLQLQAHTDNLSLNRLGA